MTALTDAVARAVDSEWRTTREIVTRAGFEPTPPAVRSASTRLHAMARQKRVEQRKEAFSDATGAGRRASWRLAR